MTVLVVAGEGLYQESVHLEAERLQELLHRNCDDPIYLSDGIPRDTKVEIQIRVLMKQMDFKSAGTQDLL